MSELDNSRLPPALPWRHRVQHLWGTAVGKGFGIVLGRIRHGQLRLTWPDGHMSVHGECGLPSEAGVHVQLHSYTALRRLLFDGEIGFAESYLQGEWSADDLCRFFSLVLANEHLIDTSTHGAWWSRVKNLLSHSSNDNSLCGSRRNIAYHYDLGNEFYRLWLDQSMSYSSGLYVEPATTLAQSQQAKMQRVIELMQPAPGARVLEIGCGWGATAQALAAGTGCEVTGISLSAEQLDYARQQHHVNREGDASAVLTEFRYQDYRDVQGPFDHVVSIEMFEAVGERYWETYFAKLAELLREGGTAVLQVITILEDRFELYRRNPDFIQRYVFPGGMLPTRTALRDLAERAGLELEQADWFGHSYARTLADWRVRFERALSEVRNLGFDERFVRMWRYYLSYCEAGFRAGSTDVGLLRLRKR